MFNGWLISMRKHCSKTSASADELHSKNTKVFQLEENLPTIGCFLFNVLALRRTFFSLSSTPDKAIFQYNPL